MDNLQANDAQAQQVLAYWFDELEPKQWYMGGKVVDDQIQERFMDVVEAGLRGELWHWRRDAPGLLAEIIVLDQFTRNCFRGTARAFAGDPIALTLCQEMVARGWDKALSDPQKSFAYMPMMHAESVVVHQAAKALFHQPGLEGSAKFFDDHAQVVARFGRYPTRNNALGRATTPIEQEYLNNASGWGQ